MSPTFDQFSQAIEQHSWDDAQAIVQAGLDSNKGGPTGMTPLAMAAAAGCLDVMRELLARGAKVNVRFGSESTTPLINAVFAGQEPSVELLLAHGANVRLRSSRRATPLHHAAGFGQAGIVRQLLDLGANPRPKNAHSATPLEVAAGAAWASRMIQNDMRELNPNAVVDHGAVADLLVSFELSSRRLSRARRLADGDSAVTAVIDRELRRRA